MTKGQIVVVCIVGVVGFAGVFVVGWPTTEEHGEAGPHAFPGRQDDEAPGGCAPAAEPTSRPAGGRTGRMSLGRFVGNVVYDENQQLYFLQLRGARLPFKSSPLEAERVVLEAPGKTEREKNTVLLLSLLGKNVLNTTIVVNPAEEAQVMPAATDIARYMRITNPGKFAGVAYAEDGERTQSSLGATSRVRTIEESVRPVVELKGQRSGATTTRVTVESGKVIVEGETYEGLYRAADRICITLLKMLCGSPDCPDAAACASGGGCGCG